MRFASSFRPVIAGALVLTAVIASAQQGLPEFERYGEVSVSISNQGAALPNGGLLFFNEDESARVTNGTFFNYSSSLSYSGLDSEGNDQVMTFSGTGSAQGDYGVIRTRYQGGLTNSFYSGLNDIRFDSVNNFYDPLGVPDIIQGVASAGWVDKVVYGGTATGYFATYDFRITGSNQNSKSFSLLDVNVGGSGSQRFNFFGSGAVDEVVRTTPVFIGQDGLSTSVNMVSIFQPNMAELADGTDFFGDSNFANTLELVGIELKDEFGNLVTDVQLFGASGTQYQPVPEPGAILLLGGLGALYGCSRRLKNRHS